MNNDNKVETAIAGLNCWASYATGHDYQKISLMDELGLAALSIMI